MLTDTPRGLGQSAAVNYQPRHPLQSRQEIGRRLRATREALDVKSGVMAEMIGVTKQAWSQYEAGNRRPDLTHMLAFSDRFNISLDWIYKGNPAQLPYTLASVIAEKLATQDDAKKSAEPGGDPQ